MIEIEKPIRQINKTIESICAIPRSTCEVPEITKIWGGIIDKLESDDYDNYEDSEYYLRLKILKELTQEAQDLGLYE
jgi:hypothetical protein